MRRLVLVNDEALGIFQGVDESQVFFCPHDEQRSGKSIRIYHGIGDHDDWNISGTHLKWQRLFLKEKRMQESTRVFWDVADQFFRISYRAGSKKCSSRLPI